jgi:hypothetical protein
MRELSHEMIAVIDRQDTYQRFLAQFGRITEHIMKAESKTVIRTA